MRKPLQGQGHLHRKRKLERKQVKTESPVTDEKIRHNEDCQKKMDRPKRAHTGFPPVSFARFHIKDKIKCQWSRRHNPQRGSWKTKEQSSHSNPSIQSLPKVIRLSKKKTLKKHIRPMIYIILSIMAHLCGKWTAIIAIFARIVLNLFEHEQ